MANQITTIGRPDGAELGPAMQALPNDNWRRFVIAYFELGGSHGAIAGAAKAAGFGNSDGSSSALTYAKIGQRVMNDARMIAALVEMTKKQVRWLAPLAVKAVKEIVENSGHKDQLKAATAILDRVDPAETKHNVAVTHEVVDRDKDAIEHLRYLKRLNVSREKLEETFGFTGLTRYERLLALEDAEKAKVIDAEFTEVIPDRDRADERE